jgi:hypothetical protein
MRYFSAIQQAKFRFASDEAYRQLAENAVAAHARTGNSLESIGATLADLNSRLAAVETVLKEVE